MYLNADAIMKQTFRIAGRKFKRDIITHEFISGYKSDA